MRLPPAANGVPSELVLALAEKGSPSIRLEDSASDSKVEVAASEVGAGVVVEHGDKTQRLRVDRK
jgi:hypothetical protein